MWQDYGNLPGDGRPGTLADQWASCQHDYEPNRYCGVHVCGKCDDHKGLARCYCGWSQSGGDGYRELIEMGERIEEEE